MYFKLGLIFLSIFLDSLIFLSYTIYILSIEITIRNNYEKYVFCIQNVPKEISEEIVGTIVVVTPKEFWEKRRCLDDRTNQEIFEAIRKMGYEAWSFMDSYIEVTETTDDPAYPYGAKVDHQILQDRLLENPMFEKTWNLTNGLA